MEPKWLGIDLMLVVHREAVSRFGGSDGVRDIGLLESALERPRNLYFYGEGPTIFDLAAAYGTGIVKNHPFLDGNKRTGLLSIRAFLFANGWLFEPAEVDQVTMMVALATGEIDERVLAGWIADFTTRRT
jgi:death-on-curing protein